MTWFMLCCAVLLFVGCLEQVAAAMSAYLSCVQDTESTVKLELQALSDSLVSNNDLPVIAQVCRCNCVMARLPG